MDHPQPGEQRHGENSNRGPFERLKSELLQNLFALKYQAGNQETSQYKPQLIRTQPEGRQSFVHQVIQYGEEGCAYAESHDPTLQRAED